MAVIKLDDRRQSFRHPVKLQVDLVLGDGSILPVEASGISKNGLQFRCDSWLADEIEPRGIQNHPLDRIQIKVVADLPISGENRLYARCKVIVARRLSQEEYILGLQFIGFEKSSEKVLARFINEQSKPA
jgi:hypothetical protein